MTSVRSTRKRRRNRCRKQANVKKSKWSGRCAHTNTELVAFGSAHNNNCVKCIDCDERVRACVRCLTHVTGSNFARHSKKCVSSKYEMSLHGTVGIRRRDSGSGKFSASKKRQPRRPGRGATMELFHPSKWVLFFVFCVCVH